MLRDEIVAIIKARVFRPGDTSLDAKIVTEMRLVQEQLLENAVVLPWFLLSEFQTISTTIDEERLPLPTNFLREHEECSLWINNPDLDKFVPLTKDDYDTLLNTYPTAALPVAYALDGKYFRLKPTPDAVYTIKQRVYVRATSLATNIENDWLLYAADLMIGEVGQVIARNYLDNAPLADKFLIDIEKARARLALVEEARLHANRSYTMGD